MQPNYGYKHTKGFLVFILVVIIMAITAAYAQTSPNTPSGYSIDNQTGNLITNSGITSATGWAVTAGSPTWTPVSPGGVFDADGYTYSYGRESLGQAGISLGSFNHGYLNSSAVFVTGFSYGLTYRFPCANSFGTNCDGTSQTAAPANPVQDNLRVEVGYYPSTGNATFYTHQLGLKNINDGNPAYNPNWQTLAETVTFAGAKPLAQAGSVNFEIIGNDAGNWACLNGACNGPQVKNAYIRANYSVDPCILNPAFNPNCPGFNNVLQGSLSPTFYYSYNIAQSLPHIGGGVVLHGYDYGFNWYNYGACYNTFMFWCTDWRTDGGGNINFRISDKNNTTMLQQQWYVAGDNSSGSYNNRYLFTESRNSLDMGSVQWWTSNVWNHFGWVGWTRPIWTPDPCFTNGLYSPNCSNFQDAVNKVLLDIKIQQEKIAGLSPTTSSSTTTPNGTITTTVVADNVNPTVTVTTELNSASTQQSRETSGSNSQSAELGQALSLIRQNQRRENSLASQASQTAINSASASSSGKQAELIASISVTNSQESTQSQTTVNATQEIMGFQQPVPGGTSVVNQSIQQRNTTNTAINLVTENNSTSAVVQFNAMNVDLIPSPNNAAIATVQSNNNQMVFRNESQSIFANSQSTNNNEQQSPVVASLFNIPLPVISADVPIFASNFMSDKTNPLNDILENKPIVQDMEKQTAKNETVKSNVQDNDAAAGGVSIAAIAVVPVGFNAYSFVLADAAFYAPKEIYRNQKNVDNLRAMRQLSSDGLHQQMVDQQYRRQ